MFHKSVKTQYIIDSDVGAGERGKVNSLPKFCVVEETVRPEKQNSKLNLFFHSKEI